MLRILLTFAIILVSFIASGSLAWYISRRAIAHRAKGYHGGWRSDGSDFGPRGGQHGHHGGAWGGGDGGGHHSGGGGGGDGSGGGHHG